MKLLSQAGCQTYAKGKKVEIIEIRGVFYCVEKSYLTQKVKNWSRTRLWVTLFVVFEARKTSMARNDIGP
jgi:hypothetical protein